MHINDIFDIKSYNRPETSRYEYIKELANGGMGKVSLIKDIDLNREVVMKSLHANLNKEEFIQQFIQEVKIIGGLEHPNIIPIYDFGIHDGNLFYIMKFIKGKTLREIIQHLRVNREVHSIYTWNVRVHIIQQICEALEYAHNNNVIHLDLKPENIMIGEFGEVMVMDWGISKVFDGVCDIDKNKNLIDDNISGSPSYMAPELLISPELVDYKADLYSLGSLMYEFMSLEKAHTGNDLNTTLFSVVNDNPKSLTKIKSSMQGRIPAELDYITSDLMRKAPEQRHNSAKHLKDDLQKFIEGKYPCLCPRTAMKRAAMALTRLIDGYFMEMMIGTMLLIMILILYLKVL
jgi:eukaryotic-like serine/threonine-protein kinase